MSKAELTLVDWKLHLFRDGRVLGVRDEENKPILGNVYLTNFSYDTQVRAAGDLLVRRCNALPRAIHALAEQVSWYDNLLTRSHPDDVDMQAMLRRIHGPRMERSRSVIQKVALAEKDYIDAYFVQSVSSSKTYRGSNGPEGKQPAGQSSA